MDPQTAPSDPPEFALSALEFDKVRARLAGYCASDLGARHAYALVPSTDRAWIAQSHDEIGAVEVFLAREEKPLGAHGLKDLRREATLAAKGGVLGVAALYHLGRVCTLTNQLKSALESAKGEYPALLHYALDLSFTNQVANRCESAFEDEERIRDSATPALRQIRRQLAELGGEIREKAQKLASKLHQDGVLTNPSFTIRSGRYVLPFHSGAMGRVNAIIQGTSESGATIWAEPQGLIEANNKLATLHSQEEQEIERILIEVSALVGYHAEAIRANIAVAAEIDVLLAKERLARALKATRPVMAPESGEGAAAITLKQARHPLIAPERIVPIDIAFGGEQRGLIITGPNAGGKTVALKTLGLMACMAQAGLFIPVNDGSQLPIFGAVLAEIGDQQSIELDLSSFSGHVAYLKRCIHYTDVFRDAATKPLVLLDEIGRATDPEEGSALALALTELFIGAGVFFAITTHLPALKNLVIGDHPNIIGGAVSFDVERLEPEYRLEIPAVGASYAIVLTEKMGLDPRVVERAKDFVGKRFKILELEIPALERQRKRLETQIAAMQGTWAAAERREQHQAAFLLAMERYTWGLLQSALEEAEELLREARRKVAKLAQTASRAQEAVAAQQEAEAEVQRLGALKSQLAEQARGLQRAAQPASTAKAKSAVPVELEEGSAVWIPLLKREGKVLAFKKKGKEVEVDLDGKRMVLARGQLEPLPESARRQRAQTRTATVDVVRPTNVPLWLDLTGERVHVGLEKVEAFLQDSYLAQRRAVQVVHGVGTGRLRKAIWEFLRSHPLVHSFGEAAPNEGGLGVTVVQLKE